MDPGGIHCAAERLRARNLSTCCDKNPWPVAPNHLRVGILAFKVAVLGLKFKSSTYSPKDPVCVSRFLSLHGAKGSVFLLKVALTWVLVLGFGGYWFDGQCEGVLVVDCSGDPKPCTTAEQSLPVYPSKLEPQVGRVLKVSAESFVCSRSHSRPAMA